MKNNRKNVKWTRGRSRVERPTNTTKGNTALKQKALHFSMKILNSLTGKK
jgi:hypothetical protein